jgi:hypothetical protein
VRSKRPRALTAEPTRGAGDDCPSADKVEAFKHLIGGRRISVLAHGRGPILLFGSGGSFEVAEVSHFDASALRECGAEVR